MRGLPTRLWTCDKCRRTETVLADSAPAGWRIVSSTVLAEVRNVRDKDTSAEWCQTCATTYLAPLAGAIEATS